MEVIMNIKKFVKKYESEFETARFMGIILNKMSKEELMAALCHMNKLYLKQLNSKDYKV
jgi:hypothetical protein